MSLKNFIGIILGKKRMGSMEFTEAKEEIEKYFGPVDSYSDVGDGFVEFRVDGIRVWRKVWTVEKK